MMQLRSRIAKIVENIVPLDDVEQSHKSFTQDWIASGVDLFRIEKPDIPNTHQVSYFLPFDQIESKVCLVHHKKANLWLPPGGHVEVNEHPKDTVRREMQEELFSQAEFLDEASFS